MIEDNAGNPDWTLPSERELAEELEVSRTSIREAVIALEMRGVVEVRGRAGIVILPQRSDTVRFDAINTDAGPGPFELLEARLAVESGAAAIAAPRSTSYDIMELEECIAQMEREIGTQPHEEKGDREFHMTIANMTGNAIIFSTVQALWAQRDTSRMWRKFSEHVQETSMQPLWIGDHHAIVSALKMRDPDAAYKAMWRHITNITNELIKADDLGRFSADSMSE